MNIGELYPKKWLSALDLPAGKSATVHIEAATVEQVRNPRTNRTEPKLCIAFYGKQKRLLLNKTQAYAIAAATGSLDTDTWPGHTINLSVGIAPNSQPTIVITPAAQTGKPGTEAHPEAGDTGDNPFDQALPARGS